MKLKLESLWAGASAPTIATCLALAAPGAAFAQANVELPEIVVTAQKREESLQKVPVAVTALGRDQVETLKIQSFNDLNGLAPNVTSVNSVSGSNPTVTIRGITGGNVEPGRDNGVALYLDGVYISRTTGAQFDIADIERIEVLRGPQGTLYGRNSTGGAINYITAPPKGEFYARQEVGFGNLGQLRTKTRLDLPRIGDFSISATFLHDERNGYIRNTEAGRVWNFSGLPGGFNQGERRSVKRLGDRNTEAGLIAIRYAPDAIPLVVDYKYDRTHARYSNLGQQVLIDSILASPFFPRSVPATTTRLKALPMGFTTREHLKVFGHNLTATYDISDKVQIKSITGYRGFVNRYSNDVIGGGFENIAFGPGMNYFEPLGIVSYERDRSFSQEVQLSYRSDFIDAIGGVYYFKQHTRTVNPLFAFQFLNPPNLPVPLNTTDADNHNRSIAGFGQATIHLTEQLDVTGGVRYTEDKRESSAPLSPGVPDFKAKFSHTDWTANVTYRPSETLTIYAKAGTGYLTGGIFNQRAFEPEKLLQYEVGAKTDWFGRRLRVNVAAFHSKYDDLQSSANNPNPPFLFQTFNVGKAEIQGVELEVLALPVDGLTLSANWGYSEFKYKDFDLPGVGDVTDLANSRMYRPKQNLSLGAEYKFPAFSNGIEPSVSINARWHSDMSLYLLPATLALGPAGAAIDEFTNENSAWRVDARATLAQIPVAGQKAKVAAWVRNAFDDRTIANATSVGGLITGQFPEPRTYGLDFSVEF